MPVRCENWWVVSLLEASHSTSLLYAVYYGLKQVFFLFAFVVRLLTREFFVMVHSIWYVIDVANTKNLLVKHF